jgi:hypothetical protein
LEKKKVSMMVDGTKEDCWEKENINFDGLKPSGARIILQNIKLGEMRGSEEEIIRLQETLKIAADRELLTWDDVQWVSENGVVFRFHTNNETLTQENNEGALKGHQYAIYDISPLITQLKEKLSIEPSEERPHELIHEFQQRIIKMSISSVAHAQHVKSTSGTYVVAKSKSPEK